MYFTGCMQMSKQKEVLLQGKLHARSSSFQRKLHDAKKGISLFLEICPTCYVSVSFGKQSICLAHMIYQIVPEIPMYFLASSETWIIHNYLDVIDKFMAKWPIKLTIVQTNHAAINIERHIQRLSQLHSLIQWNIRPLGNPDWTWQESRDAGEDDLAMMVDRTDWDGWFWGLTKLESKGRKLTLLEKWPGQPHHSMFKYHDGKFRSCPLARWTDDDVGAYIASYNIPLLDIYWQYGLSARTTARITRKAAEMGGVAFVKMYGTAARNELCHRFPELARYL